MVGRAGRSKACTNCRQRRIKCDEHRPTCNRCKTRGLTCDGPKNPTWIAVHDELPTEGNSRALALRNTIPGELSFVSFEDDICVAYTQKYVIKGGCVEVACDIVQRAGLTDSSLEPGLDLLRNAILCLSAAFFGEQHRQKGIKNRGLRKYGTVLRQLNAHLAHPGMQTTDETMMTAMTCMLLEIFVPTHPSGFFNHSRGIEAIIAARGPPTCRNGVNPALINGVRVICIAGAWVQRRASIWAMDEWKNISTLIDEGSFIREEMVHIYADCTALMGDMNRGLSEEATEEDRHRSLSFAKRDLQRLEALYFLWKRHNADMLDGESPTDGTEPVIANNASATTYVLYNLVFICILQIMDAHNPSAENLAQQITASLRIVKRLEIKAKHNLEESGEARSLNFIAGKLAWEVLGGHETPEGKELTNTIKKLSGTFKIPSSYLNF